jgi:hypothetical protein
MVAYLDSNQNDFNIKDIISKPNDEKDTELGSGFFGSVRRVKWKGNEVALKTIEVS